MQKKIIAVLVEFMIDLPYVIIVKVSRAGILLSKESYHKMKVLILVFKIRLLY